MNTKLIALDLDGTTLRKRSLLSDDTKDTLQQAIKAGIHVVIATGRVFSALPQCLFTIEGLEYVITSNGANIIRLDNMERIYTNCPSGQAMDRTGEILRAHSQFPVEIFTQGRAYIDEEVYNDIKKNGSDYMDAEYVLRTRTPIEDIYGFLADNRRNIENINVHFRSFDDKAAMKELLETDDSITVTSSMPHNLEIGGATTSKADAIRALCGILRIEEAEVMAVGDSLNDAAMIEAAGIGVAMGNAVAEVKKIADFITLSNEEDGVAFAVRKLVFKEI